MSHDKEIILFHLKELEYIWVKEPIRKWFGIGEIIGWNINVSSLGMKDYTIYRLQEDIDENHLPLEIKDDRGNNNFFKIYIL